MGVKERKERHKADLKQIILDAAKKIFTQCGFEDTSIRKIANEIEFSPTTIYLYYKDKSDILHALHQEGFKLLNSQFAVLGVVEDPFERLKAMGKIYIHFALTNKEYYELMFVMSDPLEYLAAHTEETEGCWTEGCDVFDLLVKAVEACQAQGYFKNADSESASLMVWSTMHGMCTLALRGHMEHVIGFRQMTTDLQGVMDRVFNSFAQMIGTLKS